MGVFALLLILSCRECIPTSHSDGRRKLFCEHTKAAFLQQNPQESGVFCVCDSPPAPAGVTAVAKAHQGPRAINGDQVCSPMFALPAALGLPQQPPGSMVNCLYFRSSTVAVSCINGICLTTSGGDIFCLSMPFFRFYPGTFFQV